MSKPPIWVLKRRAAKGRRDVLLDAPSATELDELRSGVLVERLRSLLRDRVGDAHGKTAVAQLWELYAHLLKYADDQASHITYLHSQVWEMNEVINNEKDVPQWHFEDGFEHAGPEWLDQ